MTPLPPALRREATELLVAAFDEDPYFCFLTPERAAREVFLAAVMGTNLVLGHPRGSTRALVDPELRGVCIWFAPDAYPIPFGEQVAERVRAIGGAVAQGHATPRVILRAWRMGDLLDEVHPEDEPYFYLQVLGVARAHQGRGLGSAMLRECCRQADEAGHPAYLETSKDMNRRLYERFGFRTIRTTCAESSPPIWTMRRDPQPLS